MPGSDVPPWAVRRVVPADVGARVTLRRRLPGVPVDGARWGDVIGVLLSWEAGTLQVRRRGGEVVELADADVIASRVISESPARRGA